MVFPNLKWTMFWRKYSLWPMYQLPRWIFLQSLHFISNFIDFLKTSTYILFDQLLFENSQAKNSLLLYSWKALHFLADYPLILLLSHILSLSSNYPSITLKLPSNYPSITLQLPSDYPSITLQLPSNYPWITLQLPSNYPWITLQLPSDYPSITLQLPSDYHPIIFHESSDYPPIKLLLSFDFPPIILW